MLLNDNFAFLCLRFFCLHGIFFCRISAEINLKIVRHLLLVLLVVGDVCKTAHSEEGRDPNQGLAPQAQSMEADF